MTPLTIQDILRACREAFDKNELQAQDPNNKSHVCLYASPCAIGAALPFKLAKSIDNTGEVSFRGLVNSRNDIFDFDSSGEEADDLANLQYCHDEWQSAKADGKDVSQFHLFFNKTLKNLEAKYNANCGSQPTAF